MDTDHLRGMAAVLDLIQHTVLYTHTRAPPRVASSKKNRAASRVGSFKQQLFTYRVLQIATLRVSHLSNRATSTAPKEDLLQNLPLEPVFSTYTTDLRL